MLNELYAIAKQLERANVLEKPAHPLLAKVNSNLILWIGISPKGELTAEIIQNPGLHKVAFSNNTNWPTVNVNCDQKTPWEKDTEPKTVAELLAKISPLKKEILTWLTEALSSLPTQAKKSLPLLPDCSLKTDIETILPTLQEETFPETAATKIYAALEAFLNARIAKPAPKKETEEQTQERKKEENTMRREAFSFTEALLFQKMKAAVTVGTSKNRHHILAGQAAIQATEAMPKKEEDTEDTLFTSQPSKGNFLIKSIPLLPMGWIPVARSPDFPAVHGYTPKGGGIPVSPKAQNLIRAALEYLLQNTNTHRKLTLDGKPSLILAHAGDQTQVRTKTLAALLHGGTEPQRENFLENQIAFENECERLLHEKTLPEEETQFEIELLVMETPMAATLRIRDDIKLTAKDWFKALKAWREDQHLPEPWKSLNGVRLGKERGFFETDKVLEKTIKIEKDKLKEEASSRTSASTKGFLPQILLNETENPEAYTHCLVRLQKAALEQLPIYAAAILATRNTKEDKKRSSLDWNTIQPLHSLLILTTQRLQQRMNPQNPNVTSTVPFLIGRALQQLNRLQLTYHRQTNKARGDGPPKLNGIPKGSYLLPRCEKASPFEALNQILKAARPYLDQATRIIRNLPQTKTEKSPFSPEEGALLGAAKDFRLTTTQISELMKETEEKPTTVKEIQQNQALIRLGLDAIIPRETSSEPAAK